MNWFTKRRFNKALATIEAGNEMTGTEILDKVGGDRNEVILKLAYLLSDGVLTVRYDAVKEGIFVESQTSLTDFDASVDVFNVVEAVYMKAV